MAEFKPAFVAIILFFCLFQNGCGQQSEVQNAQSQLDNWQPRRSRLRSKPVTRSVAPSPYEIPNNSSPDITTRSRQRTRSRNISDLLADPQHNGHDSLENQQGQFAQDSPSQAEFKRGRNENFRTAQQRSNIKTLEDSLNTERYQKRLERPQSARRDGFFDQTEIHQPSEFSSSRRRNDDVGDETPAGRLQRTRSRVAADRRSSSTAVDVTGTGNQTPLTSTASTIFNARSRGAFRGRTTFQDASAANKYEETPKRSRTRGFTSRYQNADTTEAAAVYTDDYVPGRVSSPQAQQRSAAELDPQLRTPYPSTPIQQFAARDPNQFNEQFPGLVQTLRAGNDAVSPQQLDPYAQSKGRGDTIFPNLSTQQFSTDPAQSARFRSANVIPTSTIQQISSGDSNQQFVQKHDQFQHQVSTDPNYQLDPAFPSAQFQQLPEISTKSQHEIPTEGNSVQQDRFQILRRLDSNEAERTPQFISIETAKIRNNLRSRGRSALDYSSTQGSLISPETSTQFNNLQPGSIRGRQGSFRSRSRIYTSSTTEATTSKSPPSSRSRIRTEFTSQSRHDKENAQPRNAPFRGRLRSQLDDNKATQLEIKERSLTEELSEANGQATTTQAPVKSSSRTIKPFRGSATAKITEIQSEDDIDTTANYPKEFLEKLKNSNGFVPPPKRAKLNFRSNGEQLSTGTAFNTGTARLKRKQYTTETYFRRVSDVTETIKREFQEPTQPSDVSNGTEIPTARPTKARYSQRFYKKLAAKATEKLGVSSPRAATNAEPSKIERTPIRVTVRKTFKPFLSTTTDFEISATELSGSGEERRKFVPKNKLTLEERKQRIARLKEKLRQNATQSELKPEESQESFVVRESLVVQANTHPGSREVYTEERGRKNVNVKSSVSSNVKRTHEQPTKPRGELKFRDIENTSNKYDLITLGSEENVQAIFVGKNTSSTTKKAESTTISTSTTTTTTTTTPTTTILQAISRTPRTVTTTTTTKPEAATQVPISTTEPDFAVLNVTLFPSTRHRFSARINSTANLSLPPDVELITTTTPSPALNTPEVSSSLERKPDLTLSVNKLFNSSLATTTSASVERATTDRNSSSTALNKPSTESLSPISTTQKSSPTTKQSGSKKKSSGRKKSKKSKSKASGNRTTTKKPSFSRANSESGKSQNATVTSATTVRTTTVNSTRNASNSNSSGVQPLSLAFSDIETIINETKKVVNSNPMTNPLPRVVPRSELNALTPETIINRTGSEDGTEGTITSIETTTLSNTNSSGNSTNQEESPGKLTSKAECINGTCKNSESQSVYFNEDNRNRIHEPIPYTRQKGIPKSPEALRKIFIYGIFPNNTVRRKPFPSEDERLSGEQPNANSALRRPSTSTPSYTAGDYYVFGVYPNNSVVRRRGWKTFDYEKYHSPYVIFGIYPNNTIVKKYPNGTTIDDEFMVSDNEIKKTFSNGKFYKGCTCAEEAHHPGTTQTTQTNESAPSTTTTTTTTVTTTTSRTEAETESNDRETEESETEEPERNAKDDAENIDFESESISQTEAPEKNEDDATRTTERSESEADESVEENEEEEEENEITTPEDSTTKSPSSDLIESKTEGPQGSLAEAEEADIVSSTLDTQEENSTRASKTDEFEGLENAEEVDDASTPRNLEDTTNSLEQEESQNGIESGTLINAEEADKKDLTESLNADSLNDAEEADIKDSTGNPDRDSLADTEESKNVRVTEERTESWLSTTELIQNIEDRKTTEITIGESTTIRSKNLEERTEENFESEKERNGSIDERTWETTDYSEDRTTMRSDNLERTTEQIEKFKDNSSVPQSIAEETTSRKENLEESTTARSENLFERTEQGYSYYEDGTTASSEILKERITEESEKTGESTTPSSVYAEETVSEINFFEDRTTAKTEYLEEKTTEEIENVKEKIKDKTEGISSEDGTTTKSESFQLNTTARSDELDDSLAEKNQNIEGKTTENVPESTTETDNRFRISYSEESEERSTESGTTESEKTSLSDFLATEEPEDAGTTSRPFADSKAKDQDTDCAKTTENILFNDVTAIPTKSSTGENLIIDLNSDSENTRSTVEDVLVKATTEDSLKVDLASEDIRELNNLKQISSAEAKDSATQVPTFSTTQSPEENTVSTSQERLDSIKATTDYSLETESPGVFSGRFEGYVYEKPIGKPFDLDEIFGYGKNQLDTKPADHTTSPTVETTGFVDGETESSGNEETSTTDYDIDIRELGHLISRLTTGTTTGTTTPTNPTNADNLVSTTEGSDVESTTNDLLNALLPLSIEYIQASASGNSVKKRHRKAVDYLDEPTSLTNLAYRVLSSSDTAPTSIPVLTTTKTTTRATKPIAPDSPARGKPKKIKNLSKTSVTAYKNLTNFTSTPPPDEVYIVTPVSSTRGNSDADYFKRGKVKFVTLTPGVVVTTNIHDENDILTMSSQHVQKVTKAPAKIPDNFLSTVFGEIEEKASSPIPDILRNVENDLQGDGLSASLARRIITLALEKAMTSTTPSVTPQSTTAAISPTTNDFVIATPTAQPTASYIQRITTSQPIMSTSATAATTKPKTTKKPTTTKKPKTTTTTTTSTTTTTTTTTVKPLTSSASKRPTSTSTTETSKTILITPKKAGNQQANKIPSPAITSPESLGSTVGPELSDGQAAVALVPSAIDPLTVLFANEKTLPTTPPSSQKVTEDLNILLSGLWQEQTSTSSKLSDASSNLVEPRKKSTKSKAALSKQASASLSESDLKILEAILQQQGTNGATQDLEQIVQNQIRLAEEVRKASRNLKKKQRPTTTTTTERPTPLGLGFLLNLFGAGSRPNGLFPNEQRNSRRQRPATLASLNGPNSTASVTPDPFNELDEGSTTGERSARGELVSAAIDVTKAVSKFMGTVLTSAAQSFQNFFRSLGR